MNKCPICGSDSRTVRNPRKWTDPGAGLYCSCTWHTSSAQEWLQKNCSMMSKGDIAWLAPQMEAYAKEKNQ